MSGRDHPTLSRGSKPIPDGPSTISLLAEKYDRRPIIPLDEVRADYFSHLTKDAFMRKLSSGDIPLPVMRIEASQKSPRSVHLRDLAAYLDARQKEAASFVRKMAG